LRRTIKAVCFVAGREHMATHFLMRNISRLAAAVMVIIAVTGCQTIKSIGSGTPYGDDWTVERFYAEAKEALEKKRFEYAIETYQKLEARYPYGPYAEQAQLDIGYAYYRNDQPEAAIAAANRFIRLHPTHPNVDYAYYLKGLVNFTQQQTIIDRMVEGDDLSDRDPRAARESFNAFRELINRFPDSDYVEDARLRLAYLLNSLARHDVQVADYYLRRGAYVAVVNRAKYIIEQYERTPSVEDALGMMAIAYRLMGMEDLAADTLRVLELNFPDSAYFKRYQNALKKGFFGKPGYL
jgi:outer membrane protein assembly factor BamD